MQPEQQADREEQGSESELDEQPIDGSHAGPSGLGRLAGLKVVDHLEEAVLSEVPLLDDRLDVSLEALAVLTRDVFRRIDKDGNLAGSRILAELGDDLE